MKSRAMYAVLILLGILVAYRCSLAQKEIKLEEALVAQGELQLENDIYKEREGLLEGNMDNLERYYQRREELGKTLREKQEENLEQLLKNFNDRKVL